MRFLTLVMLAVSDDSSNLRSKVAIPASPERVRTCCSSHARQGTAVPLGWRFDGQESQDFSISVSTAIQRTGAASAHIRGGERAANGMATMAQSIRADAFRGKRVRLSAYLRTADAQAAGVWLRVDGQTKPITLANMSGRLIKGTTDWRRYDIVLDVPAQTIGLAYGVMVLGRGDIWVDDVSVQVVDPQTPVDPFTTVPDAPPQDSSAVIARYAKRPLQPQNLGFEER